MFKADSSLRIKRLSVIVTVFSAFLICYTVMGFGVASAQLGSISGYVTNEQGQPIANIEVFAYVFDTFQFVSSAKTDSQGYYEITDLFPDNYMMKTGGNGYDWEFYNDAHNQDESTPVTVIAGQTVSNINFTLEAGGASIYGKIIDNQGNPIAGIPIHYRNECFGVFALYTSDLDGYFNLSCLPQGAARISVRPEINTQYNGRYFAQAFKNIYLSQGEERRLIIGPNEGAHIYGYVKDPSGSGLAGISVQADGEYNEWLDIETNLTGYFEMRLATGTYNIRIEEDSHVAVTQEITVTNPNDHQEINFTAYDDTTGNSITGSVNNPNSFNKEGYFLLVAIKAGTQINLENFDTTAPLSMAFLESAGPYSMMIPPNENYDLDLMLHTEESCEGNSATLRGAKLAISAGSPGEIISDQNFIYDSEGGTITGTIQVNGQPIFMATVVLTDQTGSFKGFAYTHHNGVFTFYNVPEGDYLIGARHPDYEKIAEGVSLDHLADGDTVTVNISETCVGSISGQVTDENGNPLSGIFVNARGENGIVDGTQTGADGLYHIEVPPGYYWVNAGGNGYVWEYYNETYDLDHAVIINVSEGTTETDINFSLAIGGCISGTVRDSQGIPIDGLNIEVHEYYEGYGLRDVLTDPNGRYSICELPPGYFIVRATGNEDYVEEFYNDRYDWYDADHVIILPGQTNDGIDFYLIEAGSISGVVKDEAGNPIAGIIVYAQDDIFWAGDEAETASDGTYTIRGLPPGTHYIVEAGGGDYAWEFYDNTYNYNQATYVTVSANQTTPGINFTMSEGCTISGTVTNTSGNPLGDIWINIWDEEIGYSDSIPIEINGTYSFEWIPPGNYMVHAEGEGYPSKFYDDVYSEDQATLISLSSGESISDINFVMNKEGGSISGFVRDKQGNPLSNISIGASTFDTNHFVSFDQTDPNGYYYIEGLPEGEYRLTANGTCEYAYQCYNNTYAHHEADPVHVEEDQTTTGINFTLPPGGCIEGIVTDSQNNPLGDITVKVENQDLQAGWRLQTETYGVDQGRYKVYGMPSGEYLVMAGGNGYEWECYDDAHTIDTANLVTVIGGQTASNIDFVLEPGGARISGRVIDELGNPILGVPVHYWNELLNFFEETHTGPNGGFGFDNLPEGPVDLEVKPKTDTQYNDGKYYAPAFRVFYLFHGEEITNITIQLEQGALISGYVTDSSGIGLPGITAEADYKLGEGYDTNTDSSGFYQIRLAPGSYNIRTNEDDYFSISKEITITGPADHQEVNLVAYDSTNSGFINGEVFNPGPFNKNGLFAIVAFEAGKIEDWINSSVSYKGFEEADPYSLPVPPGETYDIFFLILYENNETFSVTLREAIYGVQAGQSGDHVSGKDFIYDSEGGTITGTVIGDGRPICHATAFLKDQNGSFMGFAFTDHNGIYTLYNVPAGDYRMEIIHPNYGKIAQDIPVPHLADGATVTVDFNRNLTGNIAGVIKDEHGTPVTDLYVIAFDFDCTSRYYSRGVINSDGTYVIWNLPEGDYRVYVPGNCEYSLNWYHDAYRRSDAEPVAVVAGQTTNDINFVLKPGGCISGNIEDDVGDTKQILAVYAHEETEIAAQKTWSNESGYLLTGLPPGNYRVKTGGRSRYSGDVFPWEYYDDENNFADASLVPVIAGQITPNIDFLLDDIGASISGKVTDEQGNPIPNIIVNYSNDCFGINFYENQGTLSDHNGDFYLKNLPEGITEIIARPKSDIQYNGKYFSWTHKYVYLAHVEETNIILELKEGVLVSGEVEDASGNILPGFKVEAESNNYYSCEAVTDSSGYYEMRLPPGPELYWIGINEAGWTAVPQNTVLSDSNARVVNLTAFDDITGSFITGEIGNPEPFNKQGSFIVVVYETNQGPIVDDVGILSPLSTTILDNEGPYTLLVPPNNEYWIGFVLGHGDCVRESYTLRGETPSGPIGDSGDIVTEKDFTYESEGGIIFGTVSVDGLPALMADVFLFNSNNEFAGRTNTDQNGKYKFYNVPTPIDGYTVEARHPDYGSSSDTGSGFEWQITMLLDSDSDTIEDSIDNCPFNHNTGQEDGDTDGVGDVCDNCPDDSGKVEPGECGCGVPDTDLDNDGTPDCNDDCPYDPHKTDPGICDCGTPDIDSDGDGTLDCKDGCPNDPNKTAAGICGCGVADTDIDNDGTLDCKDNCPNDPNKTSPGVCDCGIPDIDSDSDGTLDCNDNCPNDPNKIDVGVCGCGVAETDSDGDGTSDCIDGCPDDPDKIAKGACGCGVADTDSDGDETPNCNDNCPNDPNKTAPGECGCGIADTDSDNDGTPNCNDNCPNDPGKIIPGECGCGVADIDSDGDGILNCNDGCPNDPNKTAPGVCDCGIPDIDSDNDGILDCNEDCPNDPNKTVAGVCGCGIPDTDSDSDGTSDCKDECPNDPDKTKTGACGCGFAETDSDNDGTPDCIDTCPNDPDNDIDGDNVCGDLDNCPDETNASQIDVDQDGIGNACDVCPYDPTNDEDGDGLCNDPSFTVTVEGASFDRGQDVPISGTAHFYDGSPMVEIPVVLDIKTDGFLRQYTAYTDSSGEYYYTFQPRSNEAGHYTISARAIDEGMGITAAASFDILGLYINPYIVSEHMSMNSSKTINFNLRNLGDIPLTELEYSLIDHDTKDLVTGLLDSMALPTTLNAGSSVIIQLTITAAQGNPPLNPVQFSLNVDSAEGSSETANISVTLHKAVPIPIIIPDPILAGVQIGEPVTKVITISNNGFAPMLNTSLSVHDPQTFHWITIINNHLGEINPSESKECQIYIDPPAELQPGTNVIQLDLSYNASVVKSVFLTVEVTTTDLGQLAFKVYDDTGIVVPNAEVNLISKAFHTDITPQGTIEYNKVYKGKTDSEGWLQFQDVHSGDYRYVISASGHFNYEGETTVQPGPVGQTIEVILVTNLVNIEFSVVPTTIQDEYTITLHITFATDLIKPTLLPNPSIIYLSFFPEEIREGTLAIKNGSNNAPVRDLVLDASNLDLADQEIDFVFENGSKVINLGKLGPRETVQVRWHASIPDAANAQLRNRILGNIIASANYTFSIDGKAYDSTTTTPIPVRYTKPQDLLLPHITFINDETDGDLTDLEYGRTTGRLPVTSNRNVWFDFKKIPDTDKDLKAVTHIFGGPDYNSIITENEAMWIANFNKPSLTYKGDTAYFDIFRPGLPDDLTLKEALEKQLKNDRDTCLGKPHYIGFFGKWEDRENQNAYLIPIGITTIKPRTGGGYCPYLGGGGYGYYDPPETFNEHGEVKIEIDQKATLERQAFKAGLSLNPTVDQLNEVTITLNIENMDGTDASNLFYVIPVQGTGINMNTPGDISDFARMIWEIIPSSEAGGLQPEGLNYNISATIIYGYAGNSYYFVTQKETVTVMPMPKLILDYSLPFVVMSGKPVKIGLKVTNEGAGPAHNLVISSAQPKIVENINGIHVNFFLNGSSSTFDDTGYQDGVFTINFGDVPAYGEANGYWLLTSTRDGYFIEFDANIRHEDYRGVELDPLILAANTQFVPAIGGRISDDGCYPTETMFVELWQDGNFIGKDILRVSGAYFLSIPAGDYLWLLTDSADQILLSKDITVLDEQPTAHINADLVTPDIDSDEDGLADCWELFWFKGLHEIPGHDNDNDGLSNIEEYQLGTNPLQGIFEICDGKDNDYDGEVDEEGAEGCEIYYKDADNDDYGLEADSLCLCIPEFPYTSQVFGDCNDNDASIYPGAPETCGDGIDQDCDGSDLSCLKVYNLACRSKRDKIQLTWTHVGADSYNIYRKLEGQDYSLLANITSTYSTYLDYAVSIGKTYYYLVKCICNNVEGEGSNETNITLTITRTR